jgi:protein-arginine kinase activator protein McsA
MFQKCQTGISHVGKRPEGGAIEASMDFDSQISMLRKKIDKAVAVENYEVASVLKKKIQDLMRTAVK